MSYRVRYKTHNGSIGHWIENYATREEAQRAIDGRVYDTGWTYTVEEFPDAPQWKEEAPRWTRDVPRETIMKIDDESMRAFAAGPGGVAKVTKEATAAPEPGSMAAHHVEILRERIKALEVELATVMANLAKPPSVPVGADAPGEGGDSDRRRLEALRAFLEGNEDASLTWWEGEFYAVAEDVAITAPTLIALADKLAEKEGKP